MGGENSKNIPAKGFGLRVLGVDKDSCLRNRVALYEDFIVEVNGCRELRYFKDGGEAQPKPNSGSGLTLVIYNLISDRERELTLELGFDHERSLEQ